MITASLWVPRGAAAEFPTKYHVDNDELARISKLVNLQLEDAKDDPERFQSTKSESSADMEDEDSHYEASGVKLVQLPGYVEALRTRAFA